ncbi:hypothetical protein DIPPA_23924 [Diplonema papillatum]|nr:hypothetical protein DIPPA_23924 [Diplonema papillatum]
MGTAAGSMTTLAMVSMNCRVDGDYELPIVLHPLQMRIEGSHALGCVIGNTALMIGFYGITYCVFLATSAAQPLFSNSLPVDVRGFVRFPSSALFIVIWLYQGTTLSGILLLLNAPSTWAWLLGCAVALLCVVIPVWVFHRVVDGTRWRNLARYRHDDANACRWLTFIVGPGEWVSTSPEKHWVSRYSSIVLTYRQDTAWWALLEFLGAFSLAAITATPTSDNVGCGHVKLASASVFCMLLVLELRYAPHVRQRDNWIDPATLLCEAGALVLAAGTLYLEDPGHWTALATQILLYAATGFVVVKALLDVFAELYLYSTGRRVRLQNDEWGLTAKAAEFKKTGEPDAGNEQRCYEVLDNGPASTKQLRTVLSSRLGETGIPYIPKKGSQDEPKVRRAEFRRFSLFGSKKSDGVRSYIPTNDAKRFEKPTLTAPDELSRDAHSSFSNFKFGDAEDLPYYYQGTPTPLSEFGNNSDYKQKRYSSVVPQLLELDPFEADARGTPVSANRSMGSSCPAKVLPLTPTDAFHPLITSPPAEASPPVSPIARGSAAMRPVSLFSVSPSQSSDVLPSLQASCQVVRSAVRNPAMLPPAAANPGPHAPADAGNVSELTPPASPAGLPIIARANARRVSATDPARPRKSPKAPGHAQQQLSPSPAADAAAVRCRGASGAARSPTTPTHAQLSPLAPSPPPQLPPPTGDAVRRRAAAAPRSPTTPVACLSLPVSPSAFSRGSRRQLGVVSPLGSASASHLEPRRQFDKPSGALQRRAPFAERVRMIAPPDIIT